MDKAKDGVKINLIRLRAGKQSFQAGHNDNLFHSEGGEEQAQVSHGGHGFLGVFMASGVKAITYLTQCNFYPCFEWVAGPETPEGSSTNYTFNSTISLIPVTSFQQL